LLVSSAATGLAGVAESPLRRHAESAVSIVSDAGERRL